MFFEGSLGQESLPVRERREGPASLHSPSRWVGQVSLCSVQSTLALLGHSPVSLAWLQAWRAWGGVRVLRRGRRTRLGVRPLHKYRKGSPTLPGQKAASLVVAGSLGAPGDRDRVGGGEAGRKSRCSRLQAPGLAPPPFPSRCPGGGPAAAFQRPSRLHSQGQGPFPRGGSDRGVALEQDWGGGTGPGQVAGTGPSGVVAPASACTRHPRASPFPSQFLHSAGTLPPWASRGARPLRRPRTSPPLRAQPGRRGET